MLWTETLTEGERTQVVGNLYQLIDGGNCLAWVGSGLSIPEYPDWPKAINEICSACKVPPLTERTDDPSILMTKAEDCKKANLNVYCDKLGELFGTLKGSIRRAYSFLINIPFAGYITTNFDPNFLSVKGDKQLHSYPDIFAQYLGGGGGTIFYIHGLARIGDAPTGENLVLASSDFNEAYEGSRGVAQAFLTSVLSTYHILFIGCDLKEPSMRAVFEKVNKIHQLLLSRRSSWSPPRRVALRATKYLAKGNKVNGGKRESDYYKELNEERRFNDMQIEIVRYTAGDEENHSEIDLILESLCNRFYPVMYEGTRDDLGKEVST